MISGPNGAEREPISTKRSRRRSHQTFRSRFTILALTAATFIAGIPGSSDAQVFQPARPTEGPLPADVIRPGQTEPSFVNPTATPKPVSTETPSTKNEIPGSRKTNRRILITDSLSHSGAALSDAIRATNVRVEKTIPQLNITAAQVPEGQDINETLKEYQRRGVRAEEDKVIRLAPAIRSVSVPPPFTAITNDGLASQMWHPESMELTRLVWARANYGLTPGNRKILLGIFDTGMNPHPDLPSPVYQKDFHLRDIIWIITVMVL